MSGWLKGLYLKYMKGAKDNEFPFSKYGFMGERLNDPVYNCDVHKNVGCAHVDGYLCDMKTCNILKDYKEKSGEFKVILINKVDVSNG